MGRVTGQDLQGRDRPAALHEPRGHPQDRGRTGGLPPMPASTFIQMPSWEERWARNPQEKREIAHRVHEC